MLDVTLKDRLSVLNNASAEPLLLIFDKRVYGEGVEGDGEGGTEGMMGTGDKKEERWLEKGARDMEKRMGKVG